MDGGDGGKRGVGGGWWISGWIGGWVGGLLDGWVNWWMDRFLSDGWIDG